MSHPIQERISNTDFDTLADAEITSLLLESWEIVCEENARDLHLVSKHSADQWLKFRDETNKDIKHIVNDFYKYNERLPDDQRKSAITYLNKIGGARQEAMGTPAEPDVLTEPEETLEERQERYESIENKHGFFSRLKGLLGK